MIRKVIDYINKNNMIEEGDRIVVGISGGADSVCLFHILLTLCQDRQITIVAVHINHGIRGEEADQDEHYVKEICRNKGIDCHSFFYEVKKLAAEEGISEEEAGRNVRYQSFLEVCKNHRCNKIAVAHNKNDNAETVLFNLFRGTGMKGLSGIEPVREMQTEFGKISLIRPLLCMERKGIEEYLSNQGIPYRTDSTNLTLDYSRNKIRNYILAFVAKEINSGVIGNISETSLKLREALDYIESNTMRCYHRIVSNQEGIYFISVKDLMIEPDVIQKGILRKVMEQLAGHLKDLESKHVEATISLLDKQVGRQIHLPYGIVAERGYEDLRIFLKHDIISKDLVGKPIETIHLTIPGRIYVPTLQKYLITEIIKYENYETIPKNSCMKWFAYDKIENAVEIRSRKEGDYIQVNASGGRKKLKDYFINQKIPKQLRDSQILITDGNHVMWILGEEGRISEKYKVDETTSKVLLMKLVDLEED